ncbi:hypothetical protein AMECASPLE_036233 [Ameca splendens]|uniref:Uncharacterized protein n=1 Tax=Ameca splendens TaxID=208324 RepID=A0ABV0Z5Y2_9TELE
MCAGQWVGMRTSVSDFCTVCFCSAIPSQLNLSVVSVFWYLTQQLSLQVSESHLFLIPGITQPSIYCSLVMISAFQVSDPGFGLIPVCFISALDFIFKVLLLKYLFLLQMSAIGSFF